MLTRSHTLIIETLPAKLLKFALTKEEHFRSKYRKKTSKKLIVQALYLDLEDLRVNKSE